MVTCKCGKQLLWTTAGRVACPAGHTMQFEVTNVAPNEYFHVPDVSGAPGTPYTGDAASLRIAPIPDAVNLQEEGAARPVRFSDPRSPDGFQERAIRKGGQG